MLVRQVMTQPPVTVHPDTSLKEAIRLLAEHQITALPVVDDHGAVLGVISEADVLLDAVLPDPWAHELPVSVAPGSLGTTVEQVMSHHPVTVPVDADLASASELMTSTTVKSLPVIEHGVVVGVISRRDIVALLARSDELIEAEVDDLVRSSGKDWLVDVVDGVVAVEGAETVGDWALARVLVGAVPGVMGVRFRP